MHRHKFGKALTAAVVIAAVLFGVLLSGVGAWYVLTRDAGGLQVTGDDQKVHVRAEKEFSLDLGGGVTLRLVHIPAGKFTMGSPVGEVDREDDEGPQREVMISKPFLMGIHEVTQEQYERVMGNNPSHFKGGQKPVDTVTWEEAAEFCRKLSTISGKTVMLPTEAQWEYACRAGTTTRFSFGDKDENLSHYGWWGCESGSSWWGPEIGNADKTTHPVGQKKPNDFGLYDMHGNVWEWCSDFYEESFADATNVDPTGPDSGPDRVLRGGCWSNNQAACRSANRFGFPPDRRYIIGSIGFRVVVDLNE